MEEELPRATWFNTTLEHILPARGFEFKPGHKIFENDEREYWVDVKRAIQVKAPYLQAKKIDYALAILMRDFMRIAEEYRKQYRHKKTFVMHPTGYVGDFPIYDAYEQAREVSSWAVDLPKGLVPVLMKKLVRARYHYIQFTHFRGIPEDDLKKEPGQLATAIDEWLGMKPVEKPDEKWTRVHPSRIENIMKRILEGKGADWDSVESLDSGKKRDAMKSTGVASQKTITAPKETGATKTQTTGTQATGTQTTEAQTIETQATKVPVIKPFKYEKLKYESVIKNKTVKKENLAKKIKYKKLQWKMKFLMEENAALKKAASERVAVERKEIEAVMHGKPACLDAGSRFLHCGDCGTHHTRLCTLEGH